MEVKEWSYKEYHSFDKPVDGVTRIPTSGDEKGTYIYSNVEYAHINGYDTAFADYHTTDKNPELCRAMSVECNISENVSLPPILMFHGTKDRTINPKVSVVVYEALKKYNKDVKLYLLEGTDHGGSEFFSDNVLDIIEEFLQKIISAS